MMIGKNNVPPPNGAYSNTVSKLAPAKFFDLNKDSGIIGARTRVWATTKATKAPIPTTIAPAPNA